MSDSNKHPSSVSRSAVFVYGVTAYVVFLATFLYAIGFIGNFGVPTSLDGAPVVDVTAALMTNVALLCLFAIQHSVMARAPFKRFITRFIPPAAERSTYVLASCVALGLLFWLWQPLGGEIWTISAAPARALLYALYAFGWALVLVSTFAINHFDLFGLRQVWRHWLGQPQSKLRFSVPLLYRIVRHPLYVGWLFVFWSTPDMTVSHLFFAAVTTAYILVAIRFEEADLMRDHAEYSQYRAQVPMLVPRFGRRSAMAAQSGDPHGARAAGAR
jgi:methanethiol S-methyltransferase